MTLRKLIVGKLGNKCARCGWVDWSLPPQEPSGVLVITSTNNETSTSQRKSNRDKFYGQVLQDIDSGTNTWQLLCANCNFIELRNRRTIKPLLEKVTVHFLIWKTSIAVADALKPLPFLENYRKEGYKVYVCPSNNFVYEYGNTTPLCTYELFREQNKLPKDTGVEGIQLFNNL